MVGGVFSKVMEIFSARSDLLTPRLQVTLWVLLGQTAYIYKITGSSSLFLKKVTKKITEEHQLFVSSSLVRYMTGSDFEITGVGGNPW